MTIDLTRRSRVDEMGTIICGEVADVGLQDLTLFLYLGPLLLSCNGSNGGCSRSLRE